MSRRNDLPHFGDQKGVEQFIAFALFWVGVAGGVFALVSLVPGLSLFWIAVLGGVCGAVVSGLAVATTARARVARAEKAAAAYRAERKAEKLQKIDKMLRSNSNIPEVKR